jgi:hypothetical protein
MKPCAILLSLLLASSGFAASDPFVGKWVWNAQKGSVAKIWAEANFQSKFDLVIGSGREPEQFADEIRLADRVSFSQPSHSAFTDHVHRFNTLDGSPRTLKGPIAFRQPNSFFNGPVVQFDQVIEVLALS